MKNILFRIFILSIFSSGLAQEYRLEMSYEINYDGGIYIENDEYLQEYYVKNENGEIIGSLMLDSDKQSFKFFNVNKDQVAYEWNLKGTDSPFNIRKRKSEVRQSDGNIIYFKTWNNNEERFDLYSIDNKLIGNLSENEESGDWELKRIMTLPYKIFVNSFELKSEYRWISGNVHQFNYSDFAISGAKVIIQKYKSQIETDYNGNFKIRAKTGDVLSISSEGYFEKIIPIGSDDFYDISMKKNKNPSIDIPPNQIITGEILKDQGYPISAATIKVKGAKNSSKSNNKGKFSVKAFQGDVLIVSSQGFKTKKITIDSRNEYYITLTQKKKKRKKSWKPTKVNGFSFNISKNVIQSNNTSFSFNSFGGENYEGNFEGYNGADITRFGAEYHFNPNSLGITIGIGKSDVLVSDEYNLSDIDFAVTYGMGLFKKFNALKLKAGLGYYSRNYNVIESFGAFYDIEEGVYYSAGLQLYIPLGESGITLDGYYNNYGLGYGIGFKF